MANEPSFKDHFSAGAAGYRRHRPGYPDALFAYLAGLCARQERAWDCGCGNGQAAVGLAAHFARVDAIDPSAEQIAQAETHARVHYAVASAEASGLPDHAYDLIVAAQAAHWFEPNAFYAEVRRVARPAAVIALITYTLPEVDPAVDALVRRLHGEIVGAYWPPERAYVDDAYRTLDFPFPEIAAPAFAERRTLTRDAFLGYLGTWSAVARYRSARHGEPLALIRSDLEACWPDGARPRAVSWPIHMRLGCVESAG